MAVITGRSSRVRHAVLPAVGPGRVMVLNHYAAIRPDFKHDSRRSCAIGVPTGVENGMFQFGKLVIQSTLSTLGTTAPAAQAMTQTLEYVSSMAGIGIGLALVPVVGQCMGSDNVPIRRGCILSA